MSGYAGQENYWSQSGQYNFDAVGFGQPNQQFDFQNYDHQQQQQDYGGQQQQQHQQQRQQQGGYLDPTQSPYGTGDMTYGANDPYGKGKIALFFLLVLQKILIISK